MKRKAPKRKNQKKRKKSKLRKTTFFPCLKIATPI